MKTNDQIIRYTTHCRFTPDDWTKVKQYCQQEAKVKFIHKGKEPISNSTFEDFTKWLESGFGSGDIVRYGHTIGIVGDDIPEKTYLVAYLRWDGELIINDMIISDPSRLEMADEEEREQIRRLLFESKQEYNVKESEFTPVCRLQGNLFYSLGDTNNGKTNIGIYCETRNNMYHFHVFLKDGKVIKDYWTEVNYTPLHKATDREIIRLQRVMGKANIVFNAQRGGFIGKNKYWYLNDAFQIVMDRDSPHKRHMDRFNVGNYFTNYEDALQFMVAVKKLRRGSL